MFMRLGLRSSKTLFKVQNSLRNQRPKWSNIRQNFRLNSTTTKDPKKPQGIKALVQEYGYSALGVYLALSCIDLPLCFILVRSLGEERINEYKDKFWQLFGYEPRNKASDAGDNTPDGNPDEGGFFSSALAAQFLVAYGLHKSLIFIRLPITAAITPRVVSQLRKWGFKIGHEKMRTIAQQAKAKATQSIVDKKYAAANSKKFGTPANKRQRWFDLFF